MPFVFTDDIIEAPRGEFMLIRVNFTGGSAPSLEELTWVLKQNGSTISGPHTTSWGAPSSEGAWFPGAIPDTAELGTATVEVTPSTAHGMISKDITIVNSPPRISITASPSSRIVSGPSQAYEFTAVESDLDSSIVSRYWKIYKPSGTEVVADDAVLEKTLSGYGNYRIELVSTDSDGAMSVGQIGVRLNQVPTAMIAPASGTIHRTVPVVLDGTGSSDDEGIDPQGYSWRVVSGPGVPIDGIYPPGGGAVTITGDAYGPEPTFTFNNNGNYVVELTVVDWDGALSTPVTRTFTVVT